MAPTRPEPVQEGDVGIHAYASQCDGIGGELKRVPADFVVTELLQDGQEVSSSSLLLSPPDPTPSTRPTGLWRGTQGPPGASRVT